VLGDGLGDEFFDASEVTCVYGYGCGCSAGFNDFARDSRDGGCLGVRIGWEGVCLGCIRCRFRCDNDCRVLAVVQPYLSRAHTCIAFASQINSNLSSYAARRTDDKCYFLLGSGHDVYGCRRIECREQLIQVKVESTKIQSTLNLQRAIAGTQYRPSQACLALCGEPGVYASRWRCEVITDCSSSRTSAAKPNRLHTRSLTTTLTT
jgi:hypothetical protein